MRATFIALLCSLTKLAVTDDLLDKPLTLSGGAAGCGVVGWGGCY